MKSKINTRSNVNRDIDARDAANLPLRSREKFNDPIAAKMPTSANNGANAATAAEERSYNRGYFQGFAAAHRSAAETVRGYFFYNIRLMVSQGMSIEEILGDLDPQGKKN